MADNSDSNPTQTSNTTPKAKDFINDAWSANTDAQTAQQLSGLTQIRQARLNQQQREAATLTTEFGATDADVVALNTSIGVQQSFTSVLGVTRDIAAITAPTVPKNGWLLHGHVRDNKLQPIATLTVCLADEQKNFLSAYGYAYTDATGYYMIPYTPDPSAPVPAPLNAYLEIMNSSGQAIYIDSAAFTLKPGISFLRDLILASQTPLGGPPPGKTPKPRKAAGSGGG